MILGYYLYYSTYLKVDMKITKYSVSGFKNLRNCAIHPRGLHAITGCNAVGKTNIMESLAFLSALMTVSESQREIMLMGFDKNLDSWIPFSDIDRGHLEFSVEGEIQVESDTWEFLYYIKFSKPALKEKTYYRLEEKVAVLSELLKGKIKGRPGPKKKMFTRNLNGETTLVAELRRGTSSFEVLQDMMVMPVIKVREAAKFETKYPMMFKLLLGISNISTISLSPKLLFEFNSQYPIPSNRINELNHHNESSISVVNLFDNIFRISSNKQSWDKFTYWLTRLLRITDTTVEIKPRKDKPEENRYTLFFNQDSKLLFTRELSSGSVILIALLSIMLDPKSEGKVFLLEEPEAYLHPKAISDFMILLQHIAEKNTILISTHNPVVLNSMSVGDVTLMTIDENYFAQTIPVLKISSATKALDRGLISFGDLLQTDFELEDHA